MDALLSATKDKNLGLKSNDAGKVNVEWLLNLLSTYDPSHKFFKKDYYPEVKMPKSDKVLVNNP